MSPELAPLDRASRPIFLPVPAEPVENENVETSDLHDFRCMG
jgi:hypothetical protein